MPTAVSTIKIVGIGDRKTRELRENLIAALGKMPPSFRIEEVRDVNDIANSGVSQTPALMVNGEVLSAGEVPSVDDLTATLKQIVMYKAKLHQPGKLLVPTDFSEASLHAYKYALALAAQLKAQVELVHVADAMFDAGSGQPGGFGLGQYIEETRRDLQALATFGPNGLKEQRPNKKQEALTTTVKPHLEFGYPETVLQRLSTDFDLIVMGTTGRTGAVARWFGSISAEVSRLAHCPVLVVPEAAEIKPIRHILYASNFESNDPVKIQQVLTFADLLNSQTHFVHINSTKSTTSALEKKLFELHFQSAETEKPFHFTSFATDHFTKGMNDYAEAKGIDLMVFVTHRHGLWDQFLKGSTTEKMVLSAKVPVLVVHQFNDVRNL